MAKDGDVRVRGTCTKASTSKLKLSDEDGRIEVEFEVDQNRNGVRWNVVLLQNGKRIARMSRVTRGAERLVRGAHPGSEHRRQGRVPRPGDEPVAARSARRRPRSERQSRGSTVEREPERAPRYVGASTDAESRIVFPSGSSTIANRSSGVTS